VDRIVVGRLYESYAIRDERQGMRKKLLFYISMFLISLSLMLIGAEILLRVSGAKPWPILSASEPTLFEWDPVLGWKSKPGEFRHEPYSPQGHEIHYTILSDGSRATSANQEIDSYDLVFLGCSFTEGLAVSDEGTFAWKLQAKFPSLRIGNFGVGGMVRINRFFCSGSFTNTI
jgi:hypothetical protein